jgi:hypothetical protein
VNPVPPEEKHLDYWSDYDVRVGEFGAPESMTDCAPCIAIVTTALDGEKVVRVPWKPNELDLAALAQGGTLWVSTWGGLPPHQLEVQA